MAVMNLYCVLQILVFTKCDILLEILIITFVKIINWWKGKRLSFCATSLFTFKYQQLNISTKNARTLLLAYMPFLSNVSNKTIKHVTTHLIVSHLIKTLDLIKQLFLNAFEDWLSNNLLSLRAFHQSVIIVGIRIHSCTHVTSCRHKTSATLITKKYLIWYQSLTFCDYGDEDE